MEKDKLVSLKYALDNSYQSETLVTSDNREFKCLINNDRETESYTDKILSIPFVAKPLNGTSEEETGIKCGDFFTWKETNTHWLVDLQYLEETAYFRGEIRKCQHEVELNGKKYWVYMEEPSVSSIVWKKSSGIMWNELNYSKIMYITLKEETYSELKRFTKVKIKDVFGILRTWEVQGVTVLNGEAVMAVALKEHFENKYGESKNVEKDDAIEAGKLIKGPTMVTALSYATYEVDGEYSGEWYVDGSPMGSETALTLEIVKNEGSFTIEYKNNGETMDSLTVKIKPL